MKHKQLNFSSELCTTCKYVGKPFTHHLIWSLASLGTKSHGDRERFTNLYMVILKSNCTTVMRDSYHHRFLVIGSHRGTGISPLRWEVTKQQRVHQICACKYTKDPPYCDATHTNLPAQVLQQQEACPRQNANHHSNNKLCTGCGWVPDF